VLETSALVVEVLLGLEALAALAVEALVGLLVEHGLAGLGRERVLEPPEQFLNGEPVLGVGGAEELVVVDASAFQAAMNVCDSSSTNAAGVLPAAAAARAIFWPCSSVPVR
jgi:hypothetical protein